jgi:NADH:ubiquinone oxidoreductase subunit K
MAGGMNILIIVILFFLGFFCLITTKSMVRMIIGIEIMARASTFAFVYFGYMQNNTAVSQSIVVTIIVVEAVVSAIALALIMSLYNKSKTANVTELNKLKG